MKRISVFAVIAVIASLGIAACGSSSSSSTSGNAEFKVPNVPIANKIGQGEGQLNIVNWVGYAEDGSTDKNVNWVTPFEQQTGCKVNSKVASTSDEMVTLMRTGNYDGVSASGNASVRLIAGGDVRPIDTKILTNWPDIDPLVKYQPYNSVNGVMYGAPHGYGANMLAYNTKAITPAPTSWSVIYDPANKGKITIYDDPITIADAALYLASTQPSLGIKNPYELDQKQFDAAVALLKKQRPLIGQFWADVTKQQQGFAQGDLNVGSIWQYTANLLTADKQPIATTLPKEGATGWSDTWMLSTKAAHPNCMLKWMNYITTPKVQAQVAEWFGEAPANEKACQYTQDKNFCETYHSGDKAYFDKVKFWATPTKNCRDGRGNVCVDYSKWVQAWTDIKG
ncbi:MAG TPA: ABC transporter substrate-binding protein [Solirubrobacteraceae bacterium]|nr:ABC transporter substrate-binding protein [Solirubrobacteraceae bacterium]